LISSNNAKEMYLNGGYATNNDETNNHFTDIDARDANSANVTVDLNQRSYGRIP
jgi:hypothetical protein